MNLYHFGVDFRTQLGSILGMLAFKKALVSYCYPFSYAHPSKFCFRDASETLPCLERFWHHFGYILAPFSLHVMIILLV